MTAVNCLHLTIGHNALQAKLQQSLYECLNQYAAIEPEIQH